jgi:ubiquinone/menaquinone biosynthesis C-methylase UbiE
MQEVSDSYYTSGDGLRAKHHLARTDSGRSFPLWALSLVPLTHTTRILDAGAGWGRFTWALIEAYGVDPQHIVSIDQSAGMLQTAAQEAAQRSQSLGLAAGDIEALPLVSARFDGMLANHVLYHLKDINAGVRELARILRPDGWLLATTNSERIRVILIDLHYQALEQLGAPFVPEEASPFSMENGDLYLSQVFRQVQRFYFEDETTYNDVKDFAALYQTTGRYRNVLADPQIDAGIKQALLPTFERLARESVDSEGVLRAPTLMGAFVCTEPIPVTP